MGFKLTSMSSVFLMPDQPETFGGPAFLTNTVFFDTGQRFGAAPADWIKVQLPNSRSEGWVKMSSGIIVPDPARPPLDVEGFVRTALIAEQAFNADPATAPNFVFADYVLALAVVESGMTNLGAKPTQSDAVGPLQITSAQWQDFLDHGKPFSDDFDNRDRPSAQVFCASYRMRADGRAMMATATPPAKITLLDLFHAYLTNSPPGAVAIQAAGATAANASKAPDAVIPALTQSLVTDVFGKVQQLVLGSTLPATFGQFTALTTAALDAALQKAFDAIQQNAPDQIVATTPPAKSGDPSGPQPGPGPAPSSGLNYKAAGVTQAVFQACGDLIVARFAAAGFGHVQQVAAVANAIGESGLDPKAKSTPPERSFGLFQCNQGGGLGQGFTREQLFDPGTNIAIVIKEAKRHKDFGGAASLSAAVDAFVTFVERPAKPALDIAKRMKIATKL
jgi:hypothetical protein